MKLGEIPVKPCYLLSCCKGLFLQLNLPGCISCPMWKLQWGWQQQPCFQTNCLVVNVFVCPSLYNIYIFTYFENQHTSISTQWKASKYIIWSHVTPGARTYSIMSVFVFLSLIKEKQWKKQWKKQGKIMTNRRKNNEK
jgi:hypothetical protein